MTERELFRDFYAIARLMDGERYGDNPFADELEVCAIVAAARAGMSDMAILGVKHSAAMVMEYRQAQIAEPSRNSVALQLTVHTFGRVRRDFA